MAILPSAGSSETVGLLVETVANNEGIDKAKAGLAELDAEAKKSSTGAANASSAYDNFNSSLKKAGQEMTAVGRSLSTYITLPVVGVAAASAKMAMDFQQSMEQLATNANVPQSAIAGLSNSVLNMAGEVGAKPEELAKAFYHIASAGSGIWSTAQQLDILKNAAEGAAIGQANVEETTNALTFAMSSNIKGAKDASEMMSVLVAIVGAGDMRMENLNAAMGTGFLGTAASFGISVQSVGAALATLTDTGMSAESAATRLRMSWAMMTSPSKQAATQLEALGLTSTDAALAADQMNAVFAKSGLTTTKLAVDLQQPNGMNVALKDLQTQLIKSGMNAAETDAMLAKAFGGGRTDAAILTLLNNLDRTDAKFKQINDTTGQFSEKWAEQQKQAKQQWNEAWAGIQADMIRLGVTIMPQVTAAMHELGTAIGGITNWFEHLSSGQKQFVIDALGVAAAVGPVLMVFGTMAKSLSEILTLTKSIGSGLGLMGKASSLAGFAGEAGLAGEAGGGLLAALGPIALGVAAVGAAAGGAYLLIKHFSDQNQEIPRTIGPAEQSIKEYGDLMQRYGVTVHGTSSEVSFYNLGQSHLADTQTLAKTITTQLNTEQAKTPGINKAAADATAIVNERQKELNDATQKYGPNSDQAKSAADRLRDAQDLLNDKLRIAAGNTLSVISKTSDLKAAYDEIKGTMDFLNANTFPGLIVGLQGVSVQAGRTAQDIQGAFAPVDQQIVSLNGRLGMLQGTSSNVTNRIMQNFGALQGGAQNVNRNLNQMGQSSGGLSVVPYASGTNYATGGWSIVGENGPERMYVPRGAQIQTNNQSNMGSTDNSTTSVNIGTVILSSAGSVTEFFRQLNQDTMNLGKGLTANQGVQ